MLSNNGFVIECFLAKFSAKLRANTSSKFSSIPKSVLTLNICSSPNFSPLTINFFDLKISMLYFINIILNFKILP